MKLTFIQSLVILFIIQTTFYTSLLLIYQEKHELKLNKRTLCVKFLIPVPFLLLFTFIVFFVFNKLALATIMFVLSILTYIFICTASCKDIHLNVFVYSLTTLPLLALIAMGNSYPSIEEGRYLGFARDIISKGHWYPFTYYDNDYYQFFHIVANYLALQMIITNMDPFTLRKVITIAISILILILSSVIGRRVTGTPSSYIMSLLVIISSPLVYLFMVLANAPLGILLTLLAITILFIITDYRGLPALVLTSITGVLSHPVYTIYLIPLLSMLTLFNKKQSKRKLYVTFLLIVAMITALYWIFSVVLKNILIKVVVNYWKALANFFIPSLHRTMTYTPWYRNIPPYSMMILAFSWTLIPSLAASYLIAKLAKQLMRRKISFKAILSDKVSLLTLYSFIMLTIPLLWYLVMKKPTMGLGFVHFYGLIFFLAPAASIVASSMIRWRLTLPLVAFLIFISLAAYGIMQDPHYNSATPALSLSSERDWIVGTTIGKFMGHDIVSQGDFRLASPLLYTAVLKGKLKYQPIQTYDFKKLYLITVAYDEKGIACIERAHFFQKHIKLKNLVLTQNYNDDVNLVYNDGFYRSLLVKSAG